MINAIRLSRSQSPRVLTTPRPPQRSHRSSPELRFRQVISLATAPDTDQQNNMDDTKKTGETTVNIMSDSFGEGYATRSDEEGFGGIYGGNQSLRKTDDDECVRENQTEYDKTQGCEVKEKEKARHQTHSTC